MAQTELDPLCVCVWSYGQERILWGFEMWKGSTVSARAGVRGTDLPQTSVFSSRCGTCSAEQWLPCAPRKWSSKADGVMNLAPAGGTLQHSSGQRLGTVTRSQDKGSGIWKGGAEGNSRGEGCAFCIIRSECSSSASVNITLVSALVTVSVWFCTQIFRAAVHNKLDGTCFKSTDFSSLLTQSRMSPCALRASSMNGTVDIGC